MIDFDNSKQFFIYNDILNKNQIEAKIRNNIEDRKLLIKVIANSTVNKNDGCVFFINAKALSS
jgi:hypothetical protein